MSYDLWFHASDGQTLTRAAWEAYAATMPLTRWADETRLLYENVNTGVYCGFDWTAAAESDDEQVRSDAQATPLAFNLNYVRPSFFGLETLPIVEKMCADLGLLVVDPQSQENGGPKLARADELIASWNAGNATASQQAVGYSKQGALTGGVSRGSSNSCQAAHSQRSF